MHRDDVEGAARSGSVQISRGVPRGVLAERRKRRGHHLGAGVFSVDGRVAGAQQAREAGGPGPLGPVHPPHRLVPDLPPADGDPRDRPVRFPERAARPIALDELAHERPEPHRIARWPDPRVGGLRPLARPEGCRRHVRQDLDAVTSGRRDQAVGGGPVVPAPCRLEARPRHRQADGLDSRSGHERELPLEHGLREIGGDVEDRAEEAERHGALRHGTPVGLGRPREQQCERQSTEREHGEQRERPEHRGNLPAVRLVLAAGVGSARRRRGSDGRTARTTGSASA